MNRKLISKTELLIVALVLVAAFIMFIIMDSVRDSSQEPVYALISVRNYPDIKVELSEDMDFTLPQNPSIRFRIEGGGMAFLASDCPDQVCVNMGFLHRVGQSAVCLPNLVSFTIRGGADELDSFLWYTAMPR